MSINTTNMDSLRQISYNRSQTRQLPKVKDKTHEEVDAEIDRFLAIGGRIHKIERGIGSHNAAAHELWGKGK